MVGFKFRHAWKIDGTIWGLISAAKPPPASRPVLPHVSLAYSSYVVLQCWSNAWIEIHLTGAKVAKGQAKQGSAHSLILTPKTACEQHAVRQNVKLRIQSDYMRL